MANEQLIDPARARPQAVRTRSWGALPAVRRIGVADVRAALAEGVEDFKANPTHYVFVALIYPVLGLVLGRMASGDALPLIYPLVSGFVLLGPFAALGLYELSRQREAGRVPTWRNAFDVLQAPQLGAILVLGAALGVLFLVWLEVAWVLYRATLGSVGLSSVGDLVHAVLGTAAGQLLLIGGTLIGFVFACAALLLGAISFPLLLDQKLGDTVGEQVSVAVQTSARAVLANKVPMAAWGVTVAVLLALGALPLLVGIAVVMPILGHATWHLYRRLMPSGRWT